ncbi:flagellar export protein FliJ [Clostridium brassicae]|uniref:Flagellar FliJ protein n=1 Tax=Clostridium brassicae TaxID=2999072 RepID=A0ABT4DBD1_9CLOT|nr:flagellar export protein FliJ [Clostridium brassicae]MCY6959602.1 flagellar export protein FliJ [Clostridium brassicae]
MGFNFRLQKVLDIRTDKEEESKRIFKKAQDEKNKVEKRLDFLKDEYNKYSKFKKECSVVERKIRQNYCTSLHFSIGETHDELKNKSKILEEKRQDLKQKQVERKTVEILKDKQKEAYIKEQNLIEQKANDEYALYSFIRNLKNRYV